MPADAHTSARNGLGTVLLGVTAPEDILEVHEPDLCRAMDKHMEKQLQQPRNTSASCQPNKRVTQGTTVPNKALSVSALYH
jgi:hypothetical protein